jgi:hypothetical protein
MRLNTRIYTNREGESNRRFAGKEGRKKEDESSMVFLYDAKR